MALPFPEFDKMVLVTKGSTPQLAEGRALHMKKLPNLLKIHVTILEEEKKCSFPPCNSM